LGAIFALAGGLDGLEVLLEDCDVVGVVLAGPGEGLVEEELEGLEACRQMSANHAMRVAGITEQRTMPRARGVLIKGQELLELSTCRDFFRCRSLVCDLLPLPCPTA